MTRSTQLLRIGSITLALVFSLSLASSHAFAQASAAGQNINVSVPGVSVKASNSGSVDMNVGGIKINANQNGAQVQVQEGANSINVNASQNGATVDVFGPPVSVRSDSDFSSYVAAVKQHDAAIADVQSTPQQLTISYVQPATLFGVIPMPLAAQMTVDATGNVAVKLPWYSFLTKNNSAAVSATVKQDTRVTSATNSFNATAQAWAVYDVSNAVSS